MNDKKIKLELTGIPPIKLEIPKPTPMIPKILESYIEKLESENNEYKIAYNELFSDNFKLQEENEELKAWKKKMIKILNDWNNEAEYISVLNKITEIREEMGFDVDE